MFTAKADGFRSLVLFLRYFLEGDKQNICVLLYRDGNCQLIQMAAPQTAYDNGGSAFDGELVLLRDRQTVRIELFDCYAYSGVTVTQSNLQKRLKLVQTLVSKCDQSAADRMRLDAKSFYPCTRNNVDTAEAFMNNAHQLDYATDGIIMVHPGAMSKTGTNGDQFKLKSKHTIDLIIIKDDDDGMHYLATNDDNEDSYVVKQELETMPEGATVHSVIECDIHHTNDVTTYTPIRVRIDKTEPNTEHVLERTLKTIDDNITIGTLFT